MNTTTSKIRLAFATAALSAALGTGIGSAHAQPAATGGVSIDYPKLDAMGIDRTGVDAAVTALGAGVSPAHPQPPTTGGVSIDYPKLDAMGIDRTGVDAAVAALVR